MASEQSASNAVRTEWDRLSYIVQTLGVGELTESEWRHYRAMLKDPVLRREGTV